MSIFDWIRAVRSSEGPGLVATGNPAAPIEHRADNGGGYNSGIRGTRGMSEWNPFLSSPGVATSRNRTTTVARAHDLFRNAPIARGAVLKRTGKVVGTGLTFHSRIDAEALGMSPTEAEAWQKTTEREFGYAAAECDLTAEADFYELQYLAFLSVMNDGDVLATLPNVPRPGSVYGTRIQLIEGARVCNPDGKSDNSRLQNGVELDENGAVVAYHVLNRHPGDVTSEIPKRWIRIPTTAQSTGRRVAKLLFFRERPGQYRGMPMVAPLLEPLQKLDKFSDSTLMNAIVSSMFTVFIETAEGESIPGLPGAGQNPNDDAPTTERELRMGSGTVMEMPKGAKPHFAQPSNPNANFDPFFLAFVRQMAMAIETPYEVLLGHYSSSYSASKAALEDAWTVWKRMREWLGSNFCDLFLAGWMDEAVSIGRIQAPGYFEDPARRKAFLGSQWIGDAQGSLDPEKDVKAAILRIQHHLSPRAAEIAALNGGTWDDTLRALAEEYAGILAAGLPVPALPGAQPSPAPSTSGDKDSAGGSNGDTTGDDE